MMRAVQRGDTIRDMTSVPDRARVRLTGISSRAYEHPPTGSGACRAAQAERVDVLLAKLFGLINERALRLMYLAGAVKVSERQFPHIYALVRDGAYILDLPRCARRSSSCRTTIRTRWRSAGTGRSS